MCHVPRRPPPRDSRPSTGGWPRRYNAFVLLATLALALLLQTPAPQPAAPLEPAPGNAVVVISTSLGDVTVELFRDKAPAAAANFLDYATEGFCPGTIFHRVVKGSVVQGGASSAT